MNLDAIMEQLSNGAIARASELTSADQGSALVGFDFRFGVPAAYAEWLARRTGGYAQSMVLEAWANIPTTAHILGGAVIGRDASVGVVDGHGRLYGYRNFLGCDGSTVPANPA